MTTPVTLEDIYDLFRTSQAEADRRFAEADRQTAELRAAEERRSAEADRRAAEADRRLEKLERIAAHTSREVAGLTSRWGQFVENLVEPAVVKLFQARGIEVQETARRIKSQRPGAQMEIDIIAVNGDVAVAIEVKSRLSRRDVDDVLEKMGRFRLAFPHYSAYQLYGAVAGIEIDAGVDRYAYQRGLFVIRQSGETVAIANDATFRPAVW
ncbi:YraN family protein [Leptolyngbya sp. PCC 6406]|uniref:YraN family protein n=1 Tax=Leptolyngbya sp. PCC 6406 TaxID=1173264 RepID=UPI0002AC7ED9|nr:YraN family protein [Leptolyngbya sp. PCC 6406]